MYKGTIFLIKTHFFCKLFCKIENFGYFCSDIIKLLLITH